MPQEQKDLYVSNLTEAANQNQLPQPELTLGQAKHNADIADQAVSAAAHHLTAFEAEINELNTKLSEACDAYDNQLHTLEQKRIDQQKALEQLAITAHSKKEQSKSTQHTAPAANTKGAKNTTYRQLREYIEQVELRAQAAGLSEEDMQEQVGEVPIIYADEEVLETQATSIEVDEPLEVEATQNGDGPVDVNGNPVLPQDLPPVLAETNLSICVGADRPRPNVATGRQREPWDDASNSNTDGRGRSRTPEGGRLAAQRILTRSENLAKAPDPIHKGSCG